jgi:NADH-quinone oxidoreductase subunit H
MTTLAFLNSIPLESLAWAAGKAIFIIFLVVLPLVSYTVYAERRVSAAIQDRVGPNRTGFPTTLLGFKKDLQIFLGGLGQPIADAMKFILKEDFTPAHVNKFYFWLAPCLAMLPLISLAFIPFGSSINGESLVIADVNVAVLGVFAVTGVGVYAIVLAGWSSNSKYPFLGAIRSSSQMIAYELSMGLSIIPVLMLYGTTSLTTIVNQQVENGWTLLPLWGDGWSWQRWLLLLPMGISLIVFTISVFAETNRLPFDMPESETELVAGYHTEYSSMKFALFFLGEYVAMIVGSSLITVFFLGGWHIPGLPDGDGQGGLSFLHILPSWILGLLSVGVFFGKVSLLLVFFIWVRWTLPRFRFDQLMRIGWLYLFEIALGNILLTAGIIALTSK